jgi:hypothetical protein
MHGAIRWWFGSRITFREDRLGSGVRLVGAEVPAGIRLMAAGAPAERSWLSGMPASVYSPRGVGAGAAAWMPAIEDVHPKREDV